MMTLLEHTQTWLVVKESELGLRLEWWCCLSLIFLDFYSRDPESYLLYRPSERALQVVLTYGP